MTCLMLLSCSGTKSRAPGVVPAIDRYEGTTYKVIKKARREGYWPDDVHILIVSAKYGLISEYTMIEDYNQKMTVHRARELQMDVNLALDKALQETVYESIFINMGHIYTQSIAASQELEHARRTGKLQEAFGQIGERLQQTKSWIVASHSQQS